MTGLGQEMVPVGKAFAIKKHRGLDIGRRQILEDWPMRVNRF